MNETHMEIAPAEPVRPAWQRRLPNVLTCARLAMTAVFVCVLAMFSYAESEVWRRGAAPETSAAARDVPWDITLLLAAVLFIAAAVTDALDGHFARKWNVTSIFGRVMDPFADKVLVLGALILLAGPGFAVWEPGRPRTGSIVAAAGFAPWMVVVILARELLVTSLRGAMESRGVDFSATTSGKLKMVLQSAAVPLVLIALAVDAPLRSLGAGASGAIGGTFERTASGWVVLLSAWTTTIVTAWSGVPYLLRAARASHAGRK